MNRRELILAGAAALGGASAGGCAPPLRRPNILLFMVDDMGWQDTSVPFWERETPFNGLYRTPGMERLAAGGMAFTNAYAAGPVCTPTRVSLMTGWSPARTRVSNWTLRPDTDTSGTHPGLLPPEWNLGGLSNSADTPHACAAPALPALLRGAGYRTIHVGKAHFGAVGTPGAEPRNLGFDVNIAGHAAGAPGSYLAREGYGRALPNKDRAWDVPGLEKHIGADTFLTEALTREAVAAVDGAVADGKPFFLNMAHYAVHVPFAPDERFMGRYTRAGVDRTEAMYASLLEGMDKSLCDLLDLLDRRGIADDTLVVFASDNGGLSAHGRGGRPHTHNAPLNSGKGSAYEGGVRVPMLARWPGKVAAGTRRHTPVITQDLFATFLRAAGVRGASDAVRAGDGRDIAPLLRGTGSLPATRPLLWHYPHVWGVAGPGIHPYSAVRSGDWKLVYFHAEPRYELFNLADDIGESRDLSAADPRRTRGMAELLRHELERSGAQMSIRRSDGRAVPLPGGRA
ncbi:MAG: sulfatase [Armatimonadetes bacterium]|nr:sulfatase [Armatimonadota bacterium]